MAILIFFLVLSALVLVHEAGHFLVAKKFGIRVDEFGLGLPPRARKLFRSKGTDFTLNWLPFGGFVRIYGENPDDGALTPDNFQTKSRWIQSGVLVAGVVCNLFFAWALLSLGFIVGLPVPESMGLPIQDANTTITYVLPNSPAEEAGLSSGDTVLSVSRGETILSEASPEEVSEFVSLSSAPVTFSIRRGEESFELTATPSTNVVEEKLAVGVSMDRVGIAKLSLLSALYHGAATTLELTYLTTLALISFITSLFTGGADLSTLTGPVGLVGIVGDASILGFTYLLSLTAVISINLAIINMIPFPALDGGRLLFVIIEGITRRSIPPKFFNALNNLGFALLLLLLILVTVQDIRNIF